MNWKDTYTRIFLQQAGKSTSEVAVAEYKPVWWQNTRSKDSGGLRLTDEGYNFCAQELKLEFYEVPFPKDFEIKTQTIIWLDKFITCPYYLTEKGIMVTEEKKAFELHLFAGDVRKYGLTKAMNRHKEG